MRQVSFLPFSPPLCRIRPISRMRQVSNTLAPCFPPHVTSPPHVFLHGTGNYTFTGNFVFVLQEARPVATYSQASQTKRQRDAENRAIGGVLTAELRAAEAERRELSRELELAEASQQLELAAVRVECRRLVSSCEGKIPSTPFSPYVATPFLPYVRNLILFLSKIPSTPFSPYVTKSTPRALDAPPPGARPSPRTSAAVSQQRRVSSVFPPHTFLPPTWHTPILPTHASDISVLLFPPLFPRVTFSLHMPATCPFFTGFGE